MAQQINIVGKQGTPAKITNRRALVVDMLDANGNSIFIASNGNSYLGPQTRDPHLIRVSNVGTIEVDTYLLNVANVGTDDGTFLGQVIKPGETIPFPESALNNVYPAGSFTYDATGTEFLINYTT